MAIFTKLKKKDIKNIFFNYDLSQLEEYFPIRQVIQNTNYYTITKKSISLNSLILLIRLLP